MIIFFPFTSFLLLRNLKYRWPCFSFFLGCRFPSLCSFLYNPFLSYNYVSNIFSIDGLSVSLILLTLWITSIIILSRQSILIRDNKSFSFLSVVFLLIVVLVITFCVNNIFYFYILFEVSLIPTLIIILGWGYQPERVQAGVYLIIYTITASLPLFICLMYIYNSYGRLFIGFNYNFSFSSNLLGLWWVICIFAFMVKIPIYLTHLWLPKAHVEAPVAGSIILAGILLKLGGYGLIRFSSLFFYINSFVLSMFVRVSMWGACVTSIICLRQTDLKSLIAYSSVGHIGLVICGIMSSQSWGWHGSFIIIIGHGVVSSGLFSLGNITYENSLTRRLYIIKGILSVLPSFSFFWFMFCVSNIAAPPSINLMSEIILFCSILNCSSYISFLIGFSSFISAGYSLYLYNTINHGQFRSINNTIFINSPRNLLILFFHLIPVFFLIVCSEHVSIWL